MKTPESFVQEYNGRAIDDDGAYGVQCVDGFRVGCKYLNIPVIPTPNNWADGYWTCLDKKGEPSPETAQWQETYFDRIERAENFRDGDWVIWPTGSASHPSSHIAMFYNGQEFSENQGGSRAFCLKQTKFSDALGALRPKAWQVLPMLDTDLTINGHKYFLVGQGTKLKPVVISPGLNKVARIRDMDVPFYIYGKITGCNFYEAHKSSDHYGMTYGDISAPLCGVYQSLDMQSTTMLYDLETGFHADCTGITVDADHNVFSPVLIYERGKNVQYALMVGLDHCTYVSRYAFLIRQGDGSYALGLAGQDLSPNQIWEDLQTVPAVQQISIIDGGDSAQMMRYISRTGEIQYLNENSRPTAGCIALIGGPVEDHPVPVPPQEAHTEAPQDEEKTGGEEPMEETRPQESPQIVPVEGWQDPEPETNIIVERIAALMSVKSLLTLSLTGFFGFLIINQIAVPEYFQEVYKIVILFFFGYQSGKASKQ